MGLVTIPKSLKNFIAKYPEVNTQFKLLIFFITRVIKTYQFLKNIDVDDSFEDSLTSISNIDKENILGVYEEEEVYFINERRERKF